MSTTAETRPVLSLQIENDALSLEYKLMNGLAFRNLNIADLMDDPLFKGVLRIPGHGLKEEPFDFFLRQIGSFHDD